jgi:hypothetical protein
LVNACRLGFVNLLVRVYSGAIIDYAERPSGVRGLIVGKFDRGIR